jgi:CPA2 family monovalent cation:H+ antiporter-2
MTLVILAPLVAIWRNLSALCLLFAQVITTGRASAARLARMVENLFKVVAGVGMYIWLASIVPLTAGARWVLLASLAAGILALFLLKRKLVLWHSELEVGLQDVLRGGDVAVADTSAPWLREHGDWELNVMECVLPDLGDCRGKRIAELDLRSRFGCTVIGIGRQGYLIPLPAPDTVLYPRDKILLLGTGAQVRAGKEALTQVSGISSPLSEFDDVRMEALRVPEGSGCSGKDLKTLSPAQSYHVQIAGIHRAGMRILNPNGDEVIHVGDELLVLGTPENIRGFRDWLAETTVDGET